jgi:FkbM family methyltransferase
VEKREVVMIKSFLINHFPFLGGIKRLGKSWYHSIRPVRRSYSQHGEDAFIVEFLSQYDLKNSIYIDVGANHPSDISNSYLLYRKGYRGIIVEPNQEFIRLFRRFRPGDIALPIGCGNANTVLPFHISKTPVLSSFMEASMEARDAKLHKTIYIPVMRLDDAIRDMKFDFVSLLSIDVEGLNYEVMEGAMETINKSLLLCLEYDTDEDRERFCQLLGKNFELKREMGCNLIFVNKTLSRRRSAVHISPGAMANV